MKLLLFYGMLLIFILIPLFFKEGDDFSLFKFDLNLNFGLIFMKLNFFGISLKGNFNRELLILDNVILSYISSDYFKFSKN